MLFEGGRTVENSKILLERESRTGEQELRVTMCCLFVRTLLLSLVLGSVLASMIPTPN